jgi:hypothetical protein
MTTRTGWPGPSRCTPRTRTSGTCWFMPPTVRQATSGKGPAAILEEEAPEVVGTFGPDGITGHPDHIRVGAATDAAFLRGAEAGHPGFRRLLHGALPQSVFDRWNQRRAAAGQPVFDPNRVYHLRGVPDEQIGVTSTAARSPTGLSPACSSTEASSTSCTTTSPRTLRAGSEASAANMPSSPGRLVPSQNRSWRMSSKTWTE